MVKFFLTTRALTCSWHQKNETTNSRIWSSAKRPASLLKPLHNDVLFLIHYFKTHFKSCFFILKTFKEILQHFKCVTWWIRGFVFLMSRTGYYMILETVVFFTFQTISYKTILSVEDSLLRVESRLFRSDTQQHQKKFHAVPQ